PRHLRRQRRHVVLEGIGYEPLLRVDAGLPLVGEKAPVEHAIHHLEEALLPGEGDVAAHVEHEALARAEARRMASHVALLLEHHEVLVARLAEACRGSQPGGAGTDDDDAVGASLHRGAKKRPSIGEATVHGPAGYLAPSQKTVVWRKVPSGSRSKS